jgi:hypothetical protein
MLSGNNQDRCDVMRGQRARRRGIERDLFGIDRDRDRDRKGSPHRSGTDKEDEEKGKEGMAEYGCLFVY